MLEDESDADQSFDVSTIRELILSALDGGQTVRKLAEASGRRVKFQTFQDLANHPPKQFPKDPKTITGMALALRVSETAIVLAYAKSLGITVTTGSNFSLRLPADVDRLSPEMQDAIINLTRAAMSAAPPNNAQNRRGLRLGARKNPGVDGAEDGEQGQNLA